MLASSLSGAGGAAAAGGCLARGRRVPTYVLYATVRGSHVDVGCDVKYCTLDAQREPRKLSFSLGRLDPSTAMRRRERSRMAQGALAEEA